MKKLTSSSKIYIAKSRVRNLSLPKGTIERGVFAKQNIKNGEVIETCPLIVVPKSDMSNLTESVLVTYFFYFGKNRLAIVLGFGSIYNHSYIPNAKYKINEKGQTITFSALKNIKKDEEITFNYSRGNLKNKSPLWFEVS